MSTSHRLGMVRFSFQNKSSKCLPTDGENEAIWNFRNITSKRKHIRTARFCFVLWVFLIIIILAIETTKFTWGQQSFKQHRYVSMQKQVVMFTSYYHDQFIHGHVISLETTYILALESLADHELSILYGLMLLETTIEPEVCEHHWFLQEILLNNGSSIFLL